MAADPRETLGVAPDASPDTIRRAFRRLVLIHHPDRHGGDVESNRQLRAIVQAYDQLLGDHGGASPSGAGAGTRDYRPPARERDTWSCPRCDDSWSFGGDCPRCGVALRDAPGLGPSDPRVDAMIESLERGERFSGELGPDSAGGIAIGLLAASGFAAQVHPPIAAMLFGYALWLSGLAFSRPADERASSEPRVDHPA